MSRMSLENFIEKVANGIRQKLGDVSVHTNENIKNNGIRAHAITILGGQSNLMPCIYLDGYFKSYENKEMEIDEIVDDIIEVHENKAVDYDFDVSVFTDYNNASLLLRGRLINTEKNEEMLEDVPHREFLDLSLIYVVELKCEKYNGIGSIRVTNEHMKLWGVTEEELYAQVRINMEQNNESLLMSIAEAMYEIMGCDADDLLSDTPEVEIPMYVLTNKNKVNGAVEIINEAVLRRFATMIGKDFVVIPSSIHECLLIPVSDEIKDMDCLAQMVREVNDTQVASNEILSYHVYKYEAQTGTIAIVA